MAGVWRLEETAVGSDRLEVALLEIDVPSRPVNTLDLAALEELNAILLPLFAARHLAGLIVRSGKPGRCIAGADLREIGAGDRVAHRRLIEAGHDAFVKLAWLPFPTVGVIDGACLGGGLELFLALDDRVASDSPATILGLPEVKLGLMPAWGGTQRLPRLIGDEAVDLIARGEPIGSRRALRLGLVAEVVPPAELLCAARRRFERRHDGLDLEAWRHRTRIEAPPSAAAAADRLLGRFRAVEPARVGAALAALGAMRDGSHLDLERALEVEKAASLDVFGTDEARSRVAAFLARKSRGGS